MLHGVVLIVSADPRRLQECQDIVREMGQLALVAATVDRAGECLSKIRPNLLLVDAQVGADRGLRLVDEMRSIPALVHVPVIVNGALTPAEERQLERDPAMRAWLDGLDIAGSSRLAEAVGATRRL